MSNLSDQKTLQNKSAVMGPTIVHLDTISDLDPAPYEGSFAYSSDKKMYFSNGSVWRTTEDPAIKTPNAVAPTDDSTTQRQLRLSGFLNSSVNTNYKQIGIVFEISLVPSMKNPIMIKTIYTTVKDSNGNDTAWPLVNFYNLLPTDTIPNLKPGDVFYWRGKYLATSGQESGFSKPFAQTFPPLIDAPKPLTGMNEITNTISVTDYHSAFGIDNFYPPYQIQWLLSLKEDFSNAISILTDIPSSNPLNTSRLYSTPGTVYYWKARYYSTPASGRKYSEYSLPASSTQVRDVATPKIVPVLGSSGKVAQLKITPYTSLSGASRLTTEWLISSSLAELDNDKGYSFTSNDSTPTILDIVSLDSTKILPNSTTIYYWKARYKNQYGIYSEYSLVSDFIRYPEIVTPTIITSANTETKTITISEFKSEYSTIYPYSSTEWNIYDKATNGLLYTETGNSNITSLNVFAKALSVSPDTEYTWTVRFKNTRNGTSTLISSSNYQIPWINKPVPITVANGTTDQDTLTASAFFSEYGVSPVSSEITITNNNGQTVAVIPNNTSPATINSYRGLRGYVSSLGILQQGTTYYWKIKYTGTLNNITRTSRYSNTSTYTQPLFINTPSIQPVSANPSIKIEGPSLTLTTTSGISIYQTVNSITDTHYASDWQLSTTPTFDGADDGSNRTITARLDKSTTSLTSWTISNLVRATTYYARVRFYGNHGSYSDWSQTITFTTLSEYTHFVTLPTNYNANPVIGEGYAGGFFAGTMWQNITQSFTTYTPANIVVGTTIPFEVPNMQSNRIVYLNQKIQLRASDQPRYIQVTGTVKGASGTTLSVLVTDVYINESITKTRRVSDWSIMTRFHIILSPKSSGSLSDIEFRSSKIGSDYDKWINFPLSQVDRTVLPQDDYLLNITSPSSTKVLDWPEEMFNISDGQPTQLAAWRFGWLLYAWYCTTTTNTYLRSLVVPELLFPIPYRVYDLNNNGGINGKTDWYLPSRDETMLCFNNLTPAEYGTGTSTSSYFAIYRYTPAEITSASLISSSQFVQSYISIKGNIDDSYPTLLDTPTTPVTAAGFDFGSNNNSDPVDHSFFFSLSNTINATPVPTYLKQTTEDRGVYYFPRSNTIFAYDKPESFNDSTQSSSYILTSTSYKSNINQPYEYNNSSGVLSLNSPYLNPIVRICGRDSTRIFGKTITTYAYNKGGIGRLVRRQLA